MNEYEEVKHLDIIHILLQVERAWLWSLLTIFGQEMLEIERFLPYSNANSFSENLVINQTMLQSLFLRKKKKSCFKVRKKEGDKKNLLNRARNRFMIWERLKKKKNESSQKVSRSGVAMATSSIP